MKKICDDLGLEYISDLNRKPLIPKDLKVIIEEKVGP